tara:strand:- start:88 stop:660 length:573 start_codon:yes stop_codon:yes gene_type:complete
MADGDIVWAAIKSSIEEHSIIELTRLGSVWIRPDSVHLTQYQVDAKYFTFESLSEARDYTKGQFAEYQRKLSERKEKLKQQNEKGEQRRSEEKIKKAHAQAQAKAETEATMEFIRSTLHIAEEFQFAVFKTFMKELVFIDTKLVNKALFAVTLNKRFKGFLYKVENDSQFLEHVSANQMKEVLEMILSRR